MSEQTVRIDFSKIKKPHKLNMCLLNTSNAALQRSLPNNNRRYGSNEHFQCQRAGEDQKPFQVIVGTKIQLLISRHKSTTT